MDHPFPAEKHPTIKKKKNFKGNNFRAKILGEVRYVRTKVKSIVTFKNLIHMSLTVIKPCRTAHNLALLL